MRNTIIAAVCVAAVLIYSTFTTMYVNDFSKSIKNELPISFYEDNVDVDINQIKDIYSGKKQILGIIINRDHAEEIEDIIINLETAVKFDDKQEIYNSAYTLKSLIEHIEKLNSFII